MPVQTHRHVHTGDTADRRLAQRPQQDLHRRRRLGRKPVHRAVRAPARRPRMGDPSPRLRARYSAPGARGS